jgi:hypothetical protein
MKGTTNWISFRFKEPIPPCLLAKFGKLYKIWGDLNHLIKNNMPQIIPLCMHVGLVNSSKCPTWVY